MRGSHHEPTDNLEIRIPHFDSTATSSIEGFLRSHLPLIEDLPYADHLHANQEIMLTERLRENCIVIGSPKSNAACEILLSKFFGAEPFNPKKCRTAEPFHLGFVGRKTPKLLQQSALTCSDLGRSQMEGQVGIAFEGGRIPANFLSPADYNSWETRKGLDCGLVFVANRPFQSSRDVKLIVLAGLSGIGTHAAAMALLEAFRYLEPLEGEKCVYGVVQAYYAKEGEFSGA